MLGHIRVLCINLHQALLRPTAYICQNLGSPRSQPRLYGYTNIAVHNVGFVVLRPGTCELI